MATVIPPAAPAQARRPRSHGRDTRRPERASSPTAAETGATADLAAGDDPSLAPEAAAAADPLLTAEDRVALFRFLVLMRGIEERGVTLYKQGKVPGSFYDGRGQEAISVGATFALGSDDVVSSPLIRDLGSHLVRGTDVTDIFRHYLGRQNEISRGREGNIHFGDRRKGVVGTVSMLPDMMVVALGLAMAFRMRNEQRVALSFFGEGATSRGDWHEAMNWAGLRKEPVIFVCEANNLAYSTPTAKQFVVRPSERAKAYGVASALVDGNDVEAVHAAVHAARERALNGGGATLVEAETMRMHGHGAHDDARYVDPELLESWTKRDPIERYANALQDAGVDPQPIRAAVTAEIDAAVAEALTAPLPDPAVATSDVFCVGEPQGLGSGDAPWSHFQERAA